MIRKMLVVAATAMIPVTGLVGAVAINATPAAAKAPIVPVTCHIGGSLVFAGGGLTENGQTGYTGAFKKTTTTANLAPGAGSDANCSTTTVIQKITQPSTTCAANGPLGSITVAGFTLLSPVTNLPGCDPANQLKPTKTYYEINSAWGFAGGSAAGSVTSGILTALSKGTKYTEANGAKLTLIPSDVNQILPGGVCGSNAGFVITGAEKVATTHTFALQLCLGTATTTGLKNDGTAPSGTFLGDLTSEILDFHAQTVDTLAISAAQFDPSTSTLVIS